MILLSDVLFLIMILYLIISLFNIIFNSVQFKNFYETFFSQTDRSHRVEQKNAKTVVFLFSRYGYFKIE